MVISQWQKPFKLQKSLMNDGEKQRKRSKGEIKINKKTKNPGIKWKIENMGF